MIERIHFENFKSLGDVTLELGRLTALVGPNGAGKSSVLQGLHLLSQTGLRKAETPRLGRFSSLFGGARDPRRLLGAQAPARMRLVMQEGGGDALCLEVAVPSAGEDDPVGERLQFEVSVSGLEGSLSTAMPRDGDRAAQVLDHPRIRQFASVVYLHLDAKEMTATSIPESETPRMRYDGHGLASTLAWMKGAREEELELLTKELARVVPGVRRIRTMRESVVDRHHEKLTVDGQPVWRSIETTVLGDRFALEFENGVSIPADLLSEGTVLALGLFAKLHEPRTPRLVLLDDIERGLHLGAQAKLVQVLRDLLEQSPELQIVCTTHSPYLLDLFNAEEVRVLTLDGQRRTRALPLTAHPEFDRWRLGLQTGELWASVGEAWVSEGTKVQQ
ncbi:MAG: AAA family ATPase [Myxococcota bacterium]|jgi:predicted ATPase|nr:AAA family ATPase [Myxococcota bacterium]